MHKALLFFLFFTIHQQGYSQIFPKENSRLNYRLIGFSFSPAPQSRCVLQIAAGNYNTDDSFKKNIILSIPADTNRVIAEVPSFGKQYTWRVIYTLNNAEIKRRFHHFSTGSSPFVDSALNRLRIITPPRQYKDAFVFNDALGVLFDMHGHPIWYLPIIDNFGDAHARDIKLSPLGTITYINRAKIREIDYNGNILWEKSDRDTIGKSLRKTNYPYHHEFTRLANGHYMTLGSETVLCKLSATDNKVAIVDDEKINRDTDSSYKKALFETLAEYDKNGEIVWLWRGSEYFAKSDLAYTRIMDGNLDMHSNSFFFDEKNNMAYISFRNISRIIKVKYPEGNVVNTYGKIFPNGTQYSRNPGENGNEFFCGQHACKCSQNGCLYLFDNGCDINMPPRVIMMQQPTTMGGKLEKKWEYEFVDKDKHYALGGGNVIELPDQSIFASLGNENSQIYIISPGKEILWNAIAEKWDGNLGKWVPQAAYKSSIITNRKDLEQLIWNSEQEQDIE